MASFSTGQGAAERFVQEVGGSFLQSPVVKVDRNGDTVEVTVRGRAISLVPLLNLTVEQVARAPME
jgi:hypothetical protein